MKGGRILKSALEERGNVAGAAQDADDVDAARGRAVEDHVDGDLEEVGICLRSLGDAAHPALRRRARVVRTFFLSASGLKAEARPLAKPFWISFCRSALILDLKIMAETVKVMVTRRGV